tara:strand:- start:2758 stop:3240 length:483 start_codon:yes stop_codon:yes gene_type:complete
VKNNHKFWIVVGILAFFHFGLHLGLGLGSNAPDLLAVALLISIRELDIGAGSCLGFLFGIMEDAFSVLAFGANAFAFTVIGIIGSKTRNLFVGDSLGFMAVYLFLGKWCKDFLHWIVAGESLRGSFIDVMLVGSSLAAVYAASVGLIVIVVSGIGWDTVR